MSLTSGLSSLPSFLQQLFPAGRAAPLPPLYRPVGGQDVWGEAKRNPLALYAGAWDRYGDLVRFEAYGQRWYLAAHPAAARQVLQERRHLYRKPMALLRPLRELFGKGLFTSEGDDWRADRALAQPAFSSERRREWAEAAVVAAEELAGDWRKRPAGSIVDLAEVMPRLAFRLTWRSLFAHDPPADWRTSLAAIEDALCYVNYRLGHPWALPSWVPTARSRAFRRARYHLRTAISTALAAGNSPISGLASTGWARGTEALCDLVLTLFVAMSESLGHALTWAWGLLGKHESAAQALTAEARTVLGDRRPGPNDLHRLPIARSVFEETLRLYPVSWVQPRQAVADDVLQGHAVPRGTVVVLFQYLTHRHPDFWDRPEEFRPERFAPERRSLLAPGCYFPFGLGDHACIGRTVALAQASLILGHLARSFTVRLESGELPLPVGSAFLRPSGPVPVSLHPAEEVATLPRSGEGIQKVDEECRTIPSPKRRRGWGVELLHPQEAPA